MDVPARRLDTRSTAPAPASVDHRRPWPGRAPAAIAGILAAAIALAGLPGFAAASSPAAAATPVASGEATPDASRRFRINLASPGDYVPQANFVQCVGASVQMMLNITRDGANRSRRTQRQLQSLARSWSGPRPPGWGERRGANVTGWAASLVINRAGPYRVMSTDTLQGAMRLAARAIRETGRPVGLLVWRGRHAWVMSGFEATADPVRDPDFRVTRAYILDPLYPHGSEAWGPSPKPGGLVSVEAVGRQFVRRSTTSPWNRLPWASRHAGKYVLVVPYQAAPPPGHRPAAGPAPW